MGAYSKGRLIRRGGLFEGEAYSKARLILRGVPIQINLIAFWRNQSLCRFHFHSTTLTKISSKSINKKKTICPKY